MLLFPDFWQLMVFCPSADIIEISALMGHAVKVRVRTQVIFDTKARNQRSISSAHEPLSDHVYAMSCAYFSNVNTVFFASCVCLPV